MIPIDFESQIIHLAASRGLIPESEKCGFDFTIPFDVKSIQQSSIWGPRLDALLTSGYLSTSHLESLAHELIQAGSVASIASCLQPSSLFQLPDLGERFLHLELIGEGATGKVFKAFDQTLKRWVALKFLKLSGSAEILLDEARAQAQVDHPNVCRIFEVGRVDGVGYLVMQLVEGVKLDTAFREMSFRQKIEIVRSVAEGVHAAHRQGLMHLDLKPANILLQAMERGEFRPLITDFGMVRCVSDMDIGYCPLGTPPYSSPEQVAGNIQKVDRRSDVYSLGVLLYIMLSCEFPFKARSFTSLLAAIRTQPPIPLRDRVPGISKDLQSIIDHCLGKDPETRYPSALALADDLQSYLEQRPVRAQEATLGYLTRKWFQRYRKSVLGLLVVIAISSGAILFQAIRISREKRKAEAEAESAKNALKFIEEMFDIVNPEKASGTTIPVRGILDFGRRKVDELNGQPLLQASIARTLAGMYYKIGQFATAKQLLEKAVANFENIYGKQHVETAKGLVELGNIYREMGQYSKAESLICEGLRIQECLLGYNHLEVASSTSRLAVLYDYQKEYLKAEALYEKVLDIRKKQLDPSRPEIADAMYSISVINWKMKKYDDAERLQLHVLNLRERTLNPNNPKIADSLDGLGTMYCIQKRYAQAKPLYERALRIREQVYGKEHPDVAETLGNIACISLLEGREAEGERAFMQSLAILEKVYGPNHVELIEDCYNLACLEAHRGNKEKTLEWLNRCVACGWTEISVLSDQEFSCLKGDPRLGKLMEKAHARIKDGKNE